jgi:uncharacterized membrane protein YjgN (DUF898 family)
LVLVAITTISVYKPWGKIQLAKQNSNQADYIVNDKKKTKKSGSFYLLIGLAVLIVIFVIMHLFGGGMHGH